MNFGEFGMVATDAASSPVGWSFAKAAVGLAQRKSWAEEPKVHQVYDDSRVGFFGDGDQVCAELA